MLVSVRFKHTEEGEHHAFRNSFTVSKRLTVQVTFCVVLSAGHDGQAKVVKVISHGSSVEHSGSHRQNESFHAFQLFEGTRRAHLPSSPILEGRRVHLPGLREVQQRNSGAKAGIA